MKLYAVLLCMMMLSCRTGDVPASTTNDAAEPLPTSNTNVQSAIYDSKKQAIVLKVMYGGGCKDHIFQLKIGRCLESTPVQCDAVLIDTTEDDFCKMINVDEVVLTIKELGWNTSYYSNASISIQSASGAKLAVALPALPLK